MWENFHFESNEDTSLDWLHHGLQHGTLLWVTDGSHIPKRGPTVSGAAWVVTDKVSRKTMACSFAETSPIADSYRAETIGLYSIHVFIKALFEHYSLDSGTVEICCDNETALRTAEGRPKRVSTGIASADVFRGIRAITRSIPRLNWTYTWVKAHMDEVLPWADLTRPQQLNVMCDNLAKQAVVRVLDKSDDDQAAPSCQLLPLENCAVFIDGVKQTSDPENIKLNSF